MGSLKGGTPAQTTSTNTPNPYVEQSYQNLMNMAMNVATSNPWQPYTGEFVAPNNLAQANAVQGLNEVPSQSNAYTYAGMLAQNQGQGYVGQGANVLGGALNTEAMGAGDIANGYNTVGQGLGVLGGGLNTIGMGAGYIPAAASMNVGAQNLIGASLPNYSQAEYYGAMGAQPLSATIGSLMSPYTQDVVNATQNQFNNQNAQQSQALLGQAIQAGNAFGGDRAGIAQAELANQQQLAQAPVIANLYNQGFQTALGGAEAQAQEQLGAGQLANQTGAGVTGAGSALGQLSGQYGNLGALLAQMGGQQANIGSQYGQLGAQQMQGGLGLGQIGSQQANIGLGYGSLGGQEAGIGSQIGNLGLGLGGLDLSDYQAMFGAGTTLQAGQQQLDTALYNQFLQQQAYPYQQIGWLGNLVEGLGAGLGGQSTTTQQQGFNPLSTLGGLGMAALLGFSDERMKENIEPVGKTFSGDTVYRYNFKGNPKTEIGLIAQDVEKHNPGAVHNIGGLKGLDYHSATEHAAHRGHFDAGGAPGGFSGGVGVQGRLPGFDAPGLGQPIVVQHKGGSGLPPLSTQIAQPDKSNQDMMQKALMKGIGGKGGGRPAPNGIGGLPNEASAASGIGSLPGESSSWASSASDVGPFLSENAVEDLGEGSYRHGGVAYDNGGMVDPEYLVLQNILSGEAGADKSLEAALTPLAQGGTVQHGHRPWWQEQSSPETAVISGGIRGANGGVAGYDTGGDVADDDSPVGNTGGLGGDTIQVADAGDRYRPLFDATEKRYSLPAGYLDRLTRIESNYNPNAISSTGASGLQQFTHGTARDYGLTNPRDPVASTDAAGRLAVSNQAYLRNSLGRDPTPAELYLAHQQGPNGAIRMLQNPDANAYATNGNAVLVNGGNRHMTNADFVSMWGNKFNSDGQDGGFHQVSGPPLGYKPSEQSAGLAPGLSAVAYRPDEQSGGDQQTMGGWNPLHLSDDARQALMAGFLGMASGTSQNALQNVAQGGLYGMSAYSNARKLSDEAQKTSLALKREEAAEARDKARFLQEQENARNLQDYRNQELKLKQQEIAGGKLEPGFQTGEKPGTQTFVPGGPHDPAQLAAEAKAKKQVGEPMSDETIHYLAEMGLTGNMKMAAGMARTAAGAEDQRRIRTEMVNIARQKDIQPEELSTRMAEYEATVAGEKALSIAAIRMGLPASSAKALIPQALEASEKVDRTQFPTINSLYEAVQKHVGGENVIRLTTALQGLSNAYAGVMARGYGSTDAARAAGDRILNEAWSKGQIKAAIDQMNREIDAELQAPGMMRQEMRQGTAPGMIPQGQQPASPAVPAASASPATAATKPKQVRQGNSIFTLQSDGTYKYSGPAQ